MGALFQSGNKNNCTGDGKGTNDLEACLRDIKDWSDRHPGHFPITVVLDKKQGWSRTSSGRTPIDFDEVLERLFEGSLYRPRDLAKHVGSDIGSLQTALHNKDWPTARELRGRVLLVLNHRDNEILRDYAEDRQASAAAFIAPVTRGPEDVTGEVRGMSLRSSGHVAMNNMAKADKQWAHSAFHHRHLGRVWGDDEVSFARHIEERVNLSAYYQFAEAMDAQGYRIRPF